MSFKADESQREDDSERRRGKYVPPNLVEYGSLTQIVRGVGTTETDSGGVGPQEDIG